MRALTAAACLALVLGWSASAHGQVVLPYQVYSPVVESVTPVPVLPPTVVEAPVAAPTVTYYAPQPTVTYYAPQPTVTYYAPQPTVSYYAPAPTVVYRPAPVYVPGPVYYAGRPVVVRPRVYVPGQPLRNVLRAAW
jgi:hypothetical protein